MGPLWPEGEPTAITECQQQWRETLGDDWAKEIKTGPTVPGTGPVVTGDVDCSDDLRLVVDVEVPPDLSDEEIAQWVARMTHELDAAHRAQGGHGLELESAESYQEARVPVPQGGPGG